MQLDKELIREVLLAVEASDTDPRAWVDLDLPDRSKQELSYHVELMGEAGLLTSQKLNTYGPDGYDVRPKRLTYKGHEFLDTVRDAEVWRRTKEGANKAGVASVQLLLDLGKAYGKQILTERLGITLE